MKFKIRLNKSCILLSTVCIALTVLITCIVKTGVVVYFYHPRDLAAMGDFRTLELVLPFNRSARISERDKDGKTALHYACKAGHLACANVLLKANVDPNIQDAKGRTSLFFASYEKHYDIVQSLIEHGASPMINTYDGTSPINVAIGNLQTRPVCPGVMDGILILLLENINEINEHAQAVLDKALMQAASDGNERAVRSLVSAGANIHATNYRGFTPLHVAGSEKTAMTLIDLGARLSHLPHADPRTSPLFIQASSGNLETFQALYREQKVDSHLVQKLFEHALDGDLEVLRFLFSLGADVSKPSNNFGQLPLCYAVKALRPDVVGLLLELGADPNISERATDVIKSVETGEACPFGNILEAEMENVALHYAVIYRCIRSGEVLFRYGADPNLKNRDGQTPLHIAVEKRDWPFVLLFLRKNASPHIPRTNGITAKDLIIQMIKEGSPPIPVDVLHEFGIE